MGYKGVDCTHLTTPLYTICGTMITDTNLSIRGTVSQNDECMSQYDAIVSHAHKVSESV